MNLDDPFKIWWGLPTEVYRGADDVLVTPGNKNDTSGNKPLLLHPIVSCDALRPELHHHDQQQAVNQ